MKPSFSLSKINTPAKKLALVLSMILFLGAQQVQAGADIGGLGEEVVTEDGRQGKDCGGKTCLDDEHKADNNYQQIDCTQEAIDAGRTDANNCVSPD